MLHPIRFTQLKQFVAFALVACGLCLTSVAHAQRPTRTSPFRVQAQSQVAPAPQRATVQQQSAAAGQAFPAGPGQFAADLPNTKLDQEIDKHFADENLPGLVVLYARDGLLTYKRVKGKADVAGNVPMSENKVMRLNSVSKWVGTILEMKLAEQGKLNLNAKVRTYLPELPAHHDYRVIDVLACRSGVRHYGETKSPDSPNHNWAEDDFATARDAIPMFWHDPLANIPGEYHYSSFAHSIADACAEKSTGKSISQLLKSTLSTPYGVSSLAVEELDDNNPQRVKFYTVKNGQNVAITPPKKEWTPSGGGMEATPMHLLKLGIQLGDNKILSAANVQKMMTRPNPLESYALGCSTATENGYHVMAKSGSAEGSNAYIWLVPERRMVMVVMANRDGAGVSGLGNKLRSIILGADKVGSNKPDLVIEEFKRTAAPRYVGGNLEIPVSFKVVNQGVAGASVSFVNSVRVSGKDRWTGFMDALPGKGSEKSVTAVIKIADPNKLLAGRTLQIQAVADAPIAAADTSMPTWGRVKEERENNNTASFSVQVPGGLGLTSQTPSTHNTPTAAPQRVKAVEAQPAKRTVKIGPARRTP